MRKFSKFLVVMLCLAVPVFGITSCSSTNVRNYFPFLSDTILTYESEDEEISYRIFVDYINENRMQRRLLLENGMMWVEVAEFRDNRLVHINTFNDLSAHIDMTTQLARGHSLILTGPIRLGTEWLQFPTTNDSRTRQITGTDIRVTTAAGTFNTIEITTVLHSSPGFRVPPSSKEFFAPGVGLVKSINFNGILESDPHGIEEETTTMRLVSIERDTGFEQTVVFFYPVDIENPENPEFFEFSVIYTTNNNLNLIHTEFLHRAISEIFDYELNPESTMNFARIDHEIRNLHVDFSAYFLDDIMQIINGDPEKELLIFHALVDTLGVLYATNAVHISFDGEPYSGLEMTLNQRQFIPIGSGPLHQ